MLVVNTRHLAEKALIETAAATRANISRTAPTAKPTRVGDHFKPTRSARVMVLLDSIEFHCDRISTPALIEGRSLET